MEEVLLHQIEDEWEVIFDDRTGNLFYKHCSTGKVQWDHPVLSLESSKQFENKNCKKKDIPREVGMGEKDGAQKVAHHTPNLSEGYVPKTSRPVREKLKKHTIRIAEAANSRLVEGRARALRASVSMDMHTFKLKEYAKGTFRKTKTSSAEAKVAATSSSKKSAGAATSSSKKSAGAATSSSKKSCSDIELEGDVGAAMGGAKKCKSPLFRSLVLKRRGFERKILKY